MFIANWWGGQVSNANSGACLPGRWGLGIGYVHFLAHCWSHHKCSPSPLLSLFPVSFPGKLCARETNLGQGFAKLTVNPVSLF